MERIQKLEEIEPQRIALNLNPETSVLQTLNPEPLNPEPG